MKKIIYFIIISLICFTSCSSWQSKKSDYEMQNTKDFLNTIISNDGKFINEQNGVIPNSKCAIKIAEIVLLEIYGKKTVNKEKPFKAILIDDYWIVSGKEPQFLWFPIAGGVSKIVISKKTGEIISIIHEK